MGGRNGGLPYDFRPDPVQIQLATELRKAQAEVQRVTQIAQGLQQQSRLLQAFLIAALDRLPKDPEALPDVPTVTITKAEIEATEGVTLQALGDPGNETMRVWVARSLEERAAAEKRGLEQMQAQAEAEKPASKLVLA